jgi:hypothetical protein
MFHATLCFVIVTHINNNGGLYVFALASPSVPSPRSIISRKANGKYKEYLLTHNNHELGPSENAKQIKTHDQCLSTRDVLHHLQSVLRSTFLPTTSIAKNLNGNPNNQFTTLKQSGYLSYITYDNLQDLTTSLRSVLATQRILEGVGVGRSGATALSATLNFLLRDGCGMVASLLFTSFAAGTFRRNIKRWKYFADIMVDIGITLEILAPSVLSTRYRTWFLPLLCLGNVCKALCGVAAGATGGALQMFWAVKLTGSEEGISEVSAKSGAQRTVMGGIGLILAGFTARWLDGARAANASNGLGRKGLWIGMYCVLTFLHLVFNWMSLKLVALDWLNGWRLHRVMNDFLTSVDLASSDSKDDVTCISPIEASNAEPIVFLPELQCRNTHLSMYPIRLGVSFNELARKSNASSFSLLSLLTTFHEVNNDNYILKVGHNDRQQHEKDRCILVAFTSECSNKEKAKAYLHACLVGRALATMTMTNKAHNGTMMIDEGDIIQHAEEVGQKETNNLWPIFERCASKVGWKLDKTEISTDGYELCFA